MSQIYIEMLFHVRNYVICSFDQVKRSVISSDLPNRIICGDIIVHSDVKHITPNGVAFTDGGFVDNIDVIVMATGYRNIVPFLDESIFHVDEKVFLILSQTLKLSPESVF